MDTELFAFVVLQEPHIFDRYVVGTRDENGASPRRRFLLIEWSAYREDGRVR